MGLSSNQARFLALTARQCDLEYRVQQICQRRLRLSSELERVATSYNNSISDRKLFTANPYQNISLSNMKSLGYSVIDNRTGDIVNYIGLMNAVSAPSGGATQINSAAEFVTAINANRAGNYVLNCDIDLSGTTYAQAAITGIFSGTFDGQGHTITGLTINAAGGTDHVGLFSETNAAASIKNVVLEGANVTVGDGTSGDVSLRIGTLVGQNRGAVDNCAVVDSNITAGDYLYYAGGLAGTNYGNITHSYATTDITGGDQSTGVGGLMGDTNMSSRSSQSFATGNITLGDNATRIGGFASDSDGDNIFTNCYSTGNITVGNLIVDPEPAHNYGQVGGFCAHNLGGSGASITNSYSTGQVTVGTGYTLVGGFIGKDTAGTNNTNFWNITSSGQATSAGSPVGLTSTQMSSGAAPISGWNTAIWDTTGPAPTLKGTAPESDLLEQRLRDGTYSLVKVADALTQNPMTVGGVDYESVDWRTVPTMIDELDKSNDIDAENKYERAVSEINSQDKKLQLEQTSVEVEYKAITSEREAVKKVLDTNAQNSFKYFS